MRRTALAIAVIAIVVGATLLAGLASGNKPVDRGHVGAHLHSRFLRSDAPLSQERLGHLVEHAGLEVVPFGLVIRTAEDRAHAPSLAHRWLLHLGDRLAIPQLNTFQLPRAEQDETRIRAVFTSVSPVLARHDNVVLVGGANEPLTRGKGWATANEAEARVRMEHRVWHEVSDLPFCHKFTPPQVNVRGMDWARMEALWTEAQDAICYDWYQGNRGEGWATLDYLRDLGDRLGKPVVILETAIPDDDPGLLEEMAARADYVSVYQLLSEPGGEDERFAGWVIEGDAFREQPPGTMLRAFLAPDGQEPDFELPSRDRPRAPAPPGTPETPGTPEVPGEGLPEVPQGENPEAEASARARVSVELEAEVEVR